MDKHSPDCNDNGKHQRHGHSRHTEVDGQDIWAAKQAYLAYTTHEPDKEEFALAEKKRILRTDPKAWDIAMQQLDEEERHSRRTLKQTTVEETRTEIQTRGINPNLPETQVPEERPVRPVRPDNRLNASDEQVDMTPPPYPQERIAPPPPPPIEHPGYAPDSKFAPPPPDSPAYHAAYDRQPAKLYGIDLPFLKLGVTDRGSLRVGANIGIASAQIDAGLDNRVEGEFMPIGGPVHARVGAGIGLDRKGLHSEVGAGANFFNQVRGDADFGARVGKTVAVAGDVSGKAVVVDAQGAAGASIGKDGADAYAGGNTHLGGKKGLGLRTGGEVSLSENSRAAAGVDLTAGNNAVTFGPAIESHGNRTVDPDLNLRTQKANRPTFHPTGDRALDTEDLF